MGKNILCFKKHKLNLCFKRVFAVAFSHRHIQLFENLESSESLVLLLCQVIKQRICATSEVSLTLNKDLLVILPFTFS